MGYPLDNSKRMEEAKNYIINILKMEGYKLNSGDLFVAFKEAGGKMEDFKSALEELTQENKIQSDNDGNIMTVEDYQREQSQQSDEENIEYCIRDDRSITTDRNCHYSFITRKRFVTPPG